MLERIYKAQRLMDKACDVLGRQINIMEVCGTHTVSIFRNGVRSTLPERLKLLSLLAGHKKERHGLVLGLLIGFAAFGYVLGLHWLLLVAVPVCGLLGAGGGWLAERRGFHVISM